jgi:hypothetical protein
LVLVSFEWMAEARKVGRERAWEEEEEEEEAR